MKRYIAIVVGGTCCLGLSPSILFAQSVNPPPPAAAATPAGGASKEKETVVLNEFVVTGVFNATKAEEATVSVSTISVDKLATQVPVSGVDLLLNVPGVFVNSSLGEIRGMVYSRGVSANTTDGATGYYYVSLQEDGLPITNVNFSNYGPDYFHRPDVTLERVEAVRGGSASITTANAPGGVFNYISRTGTDTYGGEARVRLGLQGEQSVYYRGDLLVGGPVGSTGWRYSLGGFYRWDEGHRPLDGYPINDGYQLKANLFKDYGRGSIKLYGKYLDDRNHWYEYLLALNPTDPKQAPGLSRFSTNLFPKAKHAIPFGSESNLVTFDTTDKVHSRQKAIGATWEHEFGDGWSLSNAARVSRSHADWSSSAGVAPRSLAWPNLFSTLAFQFSGGPLNGRVPAGTYNFYNRANNQLVATVTSNGSYTVSGSAPSNPGQIVSFASLANGGLEISDGSFNAVWTNGGRAQYEHMDEFMDQFSITKKLNKMTFTAGFFYSYADIDSRGTNGGRTASMLTEQPQPLSITWIPATATSAPAGTPADMITALAGWNGRTVQMTNENGFSMLGSGYARNEAVAKQYAVFFGHKWDFTKNWNIDWGVRAENYRVKGENGTGIINPRGNWDPTYGGVDGNPLTMWDNRFNVENFATSTALNTTQLARFDKDVDSLSWSVATNYVFNRSQSAYVRYTQSEKAPDYAFFRGYNSLFRLQNLKPRPQSVEQWELGYRFRKGRYTLTATPFWSRLGDIFSNPQATDSDGITPYYPEPIYNILTTYGIELEGEVQLSESFRLRSVFTWQESEGTVWREFVAGGNGRADDQYLDFSGRPSDNNPDFILNTTLSYRRGKFFSNLAWKHMGERAGNIAAVIVLPRFNQFDFGAGYDFSRRFSLHLNVNNILDDEGVMTWRGWGVDTANRQGFVTLPATGSRTLLQYVPIQPRAYFVTASYKF